MYTYVKPLLLLGTSFMSSGCRRGIRNLQYCFLIIIVLLPVTDSWLVPFIHRDVWLIVAWLGAAMLQWYNRTAPVRTDLSCLLRAPAPYVIIMNTVSGKQLHDLHQRRAISSWTRNFTLNFELSWGENISLYYSLQWISTTDIVTGEKFVASEPWLEVRLFDLFETM